MFAFYQFLPHNTFFFIIHHNPAKIYTTKYGIIKSTQPRFHSLVPFKDVLCRGVVSYPLLSVYTITF